ncbi:cell division protein FtsL [Pantoea sp. Aalb]|uniref:cell division protein FtsL n=1 Tax=Pantoea sp. Aalb TaxID=2576762 RepID=UPI00132C2C00|nr:cell division protein FtsL [Pantoea sp. Aalb]MXP67179.1 cell division protein FtsL [Pantoea sp. Aalb]
MVRKERFNLVNIIYSDMLLFGKIIILFFFVIISSILVITITHKTRLLAAQREQLILEHEALNIEWRNLILEENSLGNNGRIERIAKDKLRMQDIDLYKEHILIKKRKEY